MTRLFTTFCLAALVMSMMPLPGVQAETVLFSDDFEDGNYDGWSLEGRRKNGTSYADVESRHGSQMAHVYKQGFSETELVKRFAWQSGLRVQFDMDVSASWDDAWVGLRINFEESDGTTVAGYGIFFTGWSGHTNTSDTWQRTLVNEGFSSHDVLLDDLLPLYTGIDVNAIEQVEFNFRAYSRWNGSHVHRTWFDNFVLSDVSTPAVPAPLAVLAGGVVFMGGVMRRARI